MNDLFFFDAATAALHGGIVAEMKATATTTCNK